MGGCLLVFVHVKWGSPEHVFIGLKTYFIQYNELSISNWFPQIHSYSSSPAVCLGSLNCSDSIKGLPPWLPVESNKRASRSPERRKSLKLPPLQPSQVAVYLEEGHNSCQVAFSIPLSIPLDSVNCSLLLSLTHKGKNIQLIIALDTIFLVVSIQPTHTFVNESYIQFYPNQPVWVCHLFLSGTTFCKRPPNKYANMGIH